MAEFCFECFKRIHEIEDSESKYIISDTLDLCEGCGKWKRIVVAEKRGYYLYKFRFILVPLYILWRIIIVPYTIYNYRKMRKNKRR